MSNQFGKIPLVAGSPILEDVGGTGLSGVLIGNESGYTCKVTLQGANVVRTLYPGTVDFFEVPSGKTWNGNLQIDPSADLSNVSSWPGSYVFVDTFGPNEKPSGTFPMALNRAGNIGNQVTLVAGSSTSVQNDNNAVGTTVVEATVLTSPSSNVEIFNDGSGFFARWVNPTYTKILQWFSSGATAIQIGAASLLAEVLGNFKVDGTTELVGNVTADGTLAVTGNTSMNTASTSGLATLNSASVTNNATVGGTLGVTGQTTLSNTLNLGNQSLVTAKDSGGTAANWGGVDSSGNSFIQAHSNNNQVVIYDKNGSAIATFSGANANVNFKQGSIKRIVKFTGNAINGKLSINPNMTDTPDLVLVNYNVTGTPTSGACVGINYATLSATNIDIWSNVAAPIVGVAIKF